MNSVVGAIIIAQVDPMVKASCFDQKQEYCKMYLFVCFLHPRNDPASVVSTTYNICAHMIHALDLRDLWGFGLPAISFFTFALRNYLEWHPAFAVIRRQTSPRILQHLRDINYELSIVVARWFIPLFSDVSAHS